MIGTEREARDRVRDQRIERIVELVSPATLLEELPLGDEREQAVVRGRGEVGSRARPRATTACWSSSGPAASTTPRRRSTTPAGWPSAAERAARRPLRRDAGLLREAAHDDRLEGPDQRPAPGRLRRRQRGPAHRPRAAARGDRPRAADRLRVPRPDHAAVHLRRRRLGGDRRPHDREPDPPPARLRPLDAGRLQEPHRRRRPGRGRRGPRRRRAARLRRSRRQRHAGDPLHRRQPRRPRDPARRPRRAQLRPAPGSRTRSSSCAPPACPSGS